MSIRIALAGNPNCGKTTLFNELTGSSQYVGNWPGVTVEKKDGILKGHKNVIIQDLPGIYSLSPYTLEEKVARNYLVNEQPDVILNIIDGTNLERNLYLTTQLVEIGLPMIVAINMMDLVKKNGDIIDFDKLSSELGCPVVEISALQGKGCREAAEKAMEIAMNKKPLRLPSVFTGSVEHAIEAPVRQIADNAGLEGAIVAEKVKEAGDGIGYNAAEDKYEDMLKSGIVDPAKVTRSALQNAASIAALVLTTEAIVGELPEEKPAMPPMPQGGMGGMM